ncbi:MAG: DNA polymerase II large subunit [archaeon]
MQELIAEPHIKEYYANILSKVTNIHALANDAKKIGVDPEPEAETHPALDLAERTEKIIKLEGLANRYRTLFEEFKGNRIKVIFKIFEEILSGDLGNLGDRSKRLELAIKTALMLNTEGVVIAPIEGVPKVLISKNFDGTSYVDIYYAGPIRAAGGTSTVFPLILGDYGRKILGLDRYKPTEDEIERYCEETQLYEHIVSRQYKIKPDEVRKIIEGCPVCINGEPTEEKEVEVHRDLERIPSNRIRGGACLVISEGVALKAKKILTYAKMLNLDWSWLEGIIKVGKHADGKSSNQANWKYLEGLAAGRPIFAYPSTAGGFRLRYGRSRTGGIMSTTIHPATMYVLDEFIAIGTQLKNEKPGKATCVYACDSLEGPIVKLKNADIVQLKTSGEAKKIVNDIYEILSLGDILVCYGDFRKLAHPLLPAGYCGEWWVQELKKNVPKNEFELISKNLGNIDAYKAVELSEKYSVPLHPDYSAYYSLMSKNETIELIKAVKDAEIVKEGNRILGALMPNETKTKNILEKILLEHKIRENKILIEEKYAYAFLKTLGYSDARIDYAELENKEDALQIINAISPIKIRDKAGTFIGARMGRPESSCPREMKGNPHGLFPVGNYGGSTRSINKAAEYGRITVDVAIKRCPKCKKESHHYLCEECNVRTVGVFKCKHCGRETSDERCNACKKDSGVGYTSKILEIDTELRKAAENLKIKMPTIVKGVRGVMNKARTAEPLEKAILRAKYNLHIFRDGTVRYEMINNTLTHFKPKEINVSISKLHELGYLKDYLGKELTDDDQIVELMPQDIVICEDAGSHLLSLSNFLDEELERLYHKEPYYKAQTKEDLIGHFVLALAPHTSAAVVGRILGYNKSRGCFAHPYFHQAKRRNCLTKDTPIIIKEGNNAKIIQIGSLDNGSKEKEIPLENLKAFTINENGKIKEERIKALFKQKNPKKLLKIKTKFGRTITATGKQKILVEKEGKAIYKFAKDLKEKDRLLSLNKFDLTKPVNEINVLDWYLKNCSEEEKRKIRVHRIKEKLSETIEKKGGCWKVAEKIDCLKNKEHYKKGKMLHTALDFDALPLNIFQELIAKLKLPLSEFDDCEISYNKQKSRIRAKIQLNKEIGELVGYYLAEGYARTTDNGKRTKYVYQINLVSAEKELTRRFAKILKGISGRNATIEKIKTTETITLSGRVYYDLFTRILKCGKGARDKRIPVQLLNSNKECISAMLAAYLVGDAGIDKTCIKATSVNKELINDFCFIAARLNLFAHVFEEKEREIKTGLVREFYSKKGKRIFIKAYGLRLYSGDFKAISNHLFGKKLIIAKRNMQKFPINKKRVNKLGSFILDKIVKVEELKSKEEYVYDLIIEGEKTFIGGFGNLAIYDCDGEQDSITLIMDALLNFSNHYLPETRGGRMDAPLVYTAIINPLEIDDEVYNLEVTDTYPLDFYEKTLQMCPPDVEGIETVQNRLGTIKQYSGFKFSHAAERFDDGPSKSRYVQLKSMEEKINKQVELQGKIRAVETKDSIERVLVSHFLPDCIGNVRAFSRQKVRCTNCNASYRRIPLTGKCAKCNNGNLILTISEGSVIKYLDIAKRIIAKYSLSDYLKQRIDLVEKEINSVFRHDKPAQKSLIDFL